MPTLGARVMQDGDGNEEAGEDDKLGDMERDVLQDPVMTSSTQNNEPYIAGEYVGDQK